MKLQSLKHKILLPVIGTVMVVVMDGAGWHNKASAEEYP